MATPAQGPYTVVREGRGRLLIKATYPADGISYAIAQVMAGAFGTATSDATANLFAVAPDLLAALEATEAAEDHWANCEECEDKGAECPESGCETAFYLADKARLMRRAAIAKAQGE